MATEQQTALTKTDLAEALKPIITRLDGVETRLESMDKKLDSLIKAIPGANPGVNT
jgi:hypothetical protein